MDADDPLIGSEGPMDPKFVELVKIVEAFAQVLARAEDKAVLTSDLSMVDSLNKELDRVRKDLWEYIEDAKHAQWKAAWAMRDGMSDL